MFCYIFRLSLKQPYSKIRSEANNCTIVSRSSGCEGDKWTACVKNHRKRLLFGYYKLGFRCLEFNLFERLNKRFEPLRKDLFSVYLTKCPKCMLFTLPDQTAGVETSIYIRNEQNPVPYIGSRIRTVRLVEHMG